MGQTVKNKQILITSDFDINSHRIINVVNPTNNQDVATKYYVDAVAQGISPHQPVKVVSTGQTTLSGVQTVDDISLSNDDFILVAGQTDKTKNGIYVVNSGGSWSRRLDADGNPSNEIELGDFVFVETGTTNTSSGWVLSKTNATGSTISPDVDTQEWYKMAAPGSYLASGIGIELVGNVFTISSEISTRTSNENLLLGAISTEISNRTVVDGLLSTVVSTETSSRTSGDLSLAVSISTETSSRTSGDESLSTSISIMSGDTTDVTTILTNDEVLGMINGEITGVSYSTIVSSEASIRLSVDESLSTAIQSASPATALSGLTDVSISSVVDNDVLVWIEADSKWENRNTTDLSTVLSNDEVLGIINGQMTGVTYSTIVSSESSIRLSVDESLSTSIFNNLDSLSVSISTDISISNDSLSTTISTDLSSNLETLSSTISTDISLGNESLSTAISTNISSSDSSLSIEVSTNISSSNDSLSTVISTNMSSSLESLSSTISTDISLGNESLSTVISTNISSADSSLSIDVSTNISSSNDSLSTVISTNISTTNESLSVTISTDMSLNLETLSSNISTDISLGNESLSTAISINISSSDESLSTVISTNISTLTSVDESLSMAISSVTGATENITDNLLEGDLIFFTGLTLSGTTNLMPSLSSAIESLSTSISGTSVTSLYQLTDVSISDAQTNDILVYNEDWVKWENIPLSTAISGVTSPLNDADVSLSILISSETSNRVNNDSLLLGAMSTEVSNRTVADGLLSSAISAESSYRVSGDASLSVNISTETSIRGIADSSLSTIITAEISNRKTNDNTLSTTISTETSLRLSVDVSLSIAIGNVSPSASLSGLTDVSLSGIIDNDVLIYSGNTWINKPNLWTVSNSAVTLADSNHNLSLSNLELRTDGGALTLVDMPVTSGTTIGEEESYSLELGGNSVVRIYGQADGTSGVTDTGLVLDGSYYYAGDPTTSGSWRWFVNQDGDLEFQKLSGGTWVYRTKLT